MNFKTFTKISSNMAVSIDPFGEPVIIDNNYSCESKFV